MELYYEIVNFFYMILMNGMTAVCFVRLVKPFFREAVRVWQVGAAYFMMMEFLFYMPWHISNFSAYSLGCLAGFLVMYHLEQRNVEQKIFLCVTFFSLRWLTFTMENCIDKEYYRLSEKLSSYYATDVRVWFGLFVTDCVQDIILSVLFLMFAVSVVRKKYIYKQLAMTKKEMVMLMLPSLAAMFGYIILKFYERLYEADTGKSLFYVYGAYNWFSFFYYGISLAAIIVFIILHQDLKRKQVEEQQFAMFVSQAADMENHISEVEKLYRDIRSLKHDMENHIMVLESLYRDNEREAAKQYIEKLREKLQDNMFSVKSGNPVTDVILTEKGKKIEEKGIMFRCDFHYPEGTKADAFDISVILNNALTNAIEAAEREGQKEEGKELFISVLSYRRKNVYMIEVKNSFSGELVIGAQQLPATTKEGEGHGFGLANIRKVAQKYCGDVEIECEDGVCVVSVMLLVG